MTRSARSVAPLLAVLFLHGCGDEGHVIASGTGSGGAGGGVDAGATGGASNPATGGASSGGKATSATGGSSSKCTASGTTESKCDDGADDDCDGYVDCLDSDCDAKACGSSGSSCTGGACLAPGQNGLPELPRIDNVRVIQRGDTAIVEFEPVQNARDYRIYTMPKSEDVLVGQNGELAVKNAVYRCAGDRPFTARKDDQGAHYDASLTAGNGNMTADYVRDPADAVLGYVYLTPGPDRKPVYRMSDPGGGGGYLNADWVAPVYSEGNLADYVVGTEARDALFAKGFRDDGIQFYVPDAGTTPVYRKLYEGLWNGSASVFFTPGAEYDKRAKDDPSKFTDFGERFKVLAAEQPGAVKLHRVLYGGGPAFDLLVAGEPRYQRALEQGNQPLWSVTWPGLTEKTTLVVEALDKGCPFPGGYVSAHHAAADEFNYPSLTLDEARLSSGEVFINGQHEVTSRPKPIARAFVEATPGAKAQMDWFESFDPGSTWAPFTTAEKNHNGTQVYRNEKWAVDFSGCTNNLTMGHLLGQLVVGYADGGSSCNMSMMPRGIAPKIEAGKFLHARMSVDIPSTGRRYPQLMITTAKAVNPGDVQPLDNVPIHSRLGPMPFDMGAPPGNERTIIVQPFGGFHQLNVQFCDQRGWGVNSQCPQANIYGNHAGDYAAEWEEPWLPVPVLGDVAGFDRPVRFDVYASTERVYVFMDDQPAGCGVLPAGRMPASDVTVAFRGVLYHSGIDESVVPDNSQHQYLKRFSLSHFDRHMDDFGISLAVDAPAWDESRLPCGTRWYGGG